MARAKALEAMLDMLTAAYLAAATGRVGLALMLGKHGMRYAEQALDAGASEAQLWAMRDAAKATACVFLTAECGCGLAVAS